ncbi:cyclic nucleotide-binding domain-containing protein [Coxiella-like endosymbiont]|uniref:cyclic nucleotide-binding domain-containing protein n=1 Tax=Coxiella-like endosymbiont TaxID=1592897 RepID=UPI00272C4E1F|nr:cyclic nucleotide-binding domain-containing protein [Coxiella-like endosymbiont]
MKTEPISRRLINPGQFFGELGVIEKTSSLGTAIAVIDVTVAVIDAKTFSKFYQKTFKNLKNLINSQTDLYEVLAVGASCWFGS